MACERANGPKTFQAIPAGDRLVTFDLDGDGARQVSVIGRRTDALAIDVVSWQTGRAHVVRRPVAEPMPSAPPACQAAFNRRPDLLKAIDRLDPATLATTTVRTALGTATIQEFVTLGRTRSCLSFSQETTRLASDQGSRDAVIAINGMDCRDLHPNVRDRQRRDLLPVVESIRAGG